jgi:hypothetical protein
MSLSVITKGKSCNFRISEKENLRITWKQIQKVGSQAHMAQSLIQLGTEDKEVQGILNKQCCS